MKSIFQSNARSRRHRQTQPTEQESEQAPFFAPAEKQGIRRSPQPFFQAKANTTGVKIGQPNDTYEREADAVADAVVNKQSSQQHVGSGAPDAVQRLPITPLNSSSLQRLATPDEEKMPGTNDARMAQDKEIQEKPEAGSPMVQRMNAAKEEEKPVQKMDAPKEEEKPLQKMGDKEEEPVQKMDAPKEEEKPLQKMGDQEEELQAKEEEEALQAKTESGGATAAPDLGARLSQKKDQGNALPKSVKSEMEQGIGADFSGVRIHTDSEAVQMNKDVHAQAFTHGQDVYFNSGKYSPESTEGKRLLAHELTHVVQQGGSDMDIQRKPDDEPTFTDWRLTYKTEPEAKRQAERLKKLNIETGAIVQVGKNWGFKYKPLTQEQANAKIKTLPATLQHQTYTVLYDKTAQSYYIDSVLKNCPSGYTDLGDFKITAYPLAVESEFPKTPTITDPCGLKGTYRKTFLYQTSKAPRGVMMQGSGLAINGKYIQYSTATNCFYEAPCPLTSMGNCATVGKTVAVDPAEIKKGSELIIEDIGSRTAEDVGGSVKGKHIDVYYGTTKTGMEANNLSMVGKKVCKKK